MKYFWLLPLLLIQLTVGAQKEKKVTYYHYKKLRSAEGRLRDGKKTGLWTYWTTTGQLSKTITYSNNIPQGVYTVFDTSANTYSPADLRSVKAFYEKALQTQQKNTETIKALQGEYCEGKKCGRWSGYKSGELRTVEDYVNDTLHGITEEYTSEGKLYKSTTWSKGTRNGPFTEYNMNGTTRKKGQYLNGNEDGEWTEYRHNEKFVYHMQMGQPHGQALMYNRYDSLVGMAYFKKGLKEGPYMMVKDDGKTVIKTTYVNDKMTGWYSETWEGKPYLEYEVDMGIRDGLFNQYNKKTGEVQEAGVYKNGTRNGIWHTNHNGRKCKSQYDYGEIKHEECLEKDGSTTISTRSEGTRTETVWIKGKKVKETVSDHRWVVVHTFDEKGKVVQTDSTEIPVETQGPQEIIAADVPAGAEVLSIAEIMPDFPGGADAMRKFLTDNIRYPQLAVDAEIEGRVWIRFVVETNGQLSHVEIAKGVHQALDDEALRVVKTMPVWSPGMQDGKRVRVQNIIPVTFKLK